MLKKVPLNICIFRMHIKGQRYPKCVRWVGTNYVVIPSGIVLSQYKNNQDFAHFFDPFIRWTGQH